MSFHQLNSSAASAIPSPSEQQPENPQLGYTSLPWPAAHARPPFYPHMPYGLLHNTSVSPHLPHPLPVANALANMHHFVQAPYSLAAASFQTPGLSNPFSDITSTPVNNTAPTTTTRKHKNTAATGPKSCTKRRKNDNTTSNIQTATVCSVGPSTVLMHTDTTEPPPPPLHIYTDPSMTAQGSSTHSSTHGHRQYQASATDVWHFLMIVASLACPDELPDVKLIPRLTSNPKCNFVACRFCIANGIWKAWNHGDGMTQCYRRHFNNNHLNKWTEE
ncbi:hypothetical protein F4604DRAFT_1939414 [Suillus subluteus]|nr:hypothetical protein F4604DRAFT_1939414 [Suillus subluteus]